MLARGARWVAWTVVLGLVCGSTAIAGPVGPPRGQRVMLVILENADYDTARAQPFLAQFARAGGLLRQSFAVAHPSAFGRTDAAPGLKRTADPRVILLVTSTSSTTLAD